MLFQNQSAVNQTDSNIEYTREQVSLALSVQEAFIQPMFYLEKLYKELPKISHFKCKFHQEIYETVLIPNDKQLNMGTVRRFFTDMILYKVTPKGLNELREYHFAFIHALSLLSNPKTRPSDDDLKCINSVFIAHLKGVSIVANVFNSNASVLKIKYEDDYPMNTTPIRLQANGKYRITQQTSCVAKTSKELVDTELEKVKKARDEEERTKYEKNLELLAENTLRKAKFESMAAMLKKTQQSSVKREETVNRNSMPGLF